MTNSEPGNSAATDTLQKELVAAREAMREQQDRLAMMEEGSRKSQEEIGRAKGVIQGQLEELGAMKRATLEKNEKPKKVKQETGLDASSTPDVAPKLDDSNVTIRKQKDPVKKTEYVCGEGPGELEELRQMAAMQKEEIRKLKEGPTERERLAELAREQQKQLMSLQSKPMPPVTPLAAHPRLQVASKMKMPESFDGVKPPPAPWARTVKNYFAFYKDTPDDQRRVFTKGLLTGPAEIWWAGNDGRHATYHDLMDSLASYFLPKSKNNAAREELPTLSQTSTVIKYSATFNAIAMEIDDMSEAEKKLRCMKGVDPRINTALCAKLESHDNALHLQAAAAQVGSALALEDRQRKPACAPQLGAIGRERPPVRPERDQRDNAPE